MFSTILEILNRSQKPAEESACFSRKDVQTPFKLSVEISSGQNSDFNFFADGFLKNLYKQACIKTAKKRTSVYKLVLIILYCAVILFMAITFKYKDTALRLLHILFIFIMLFVMLFIPLCNAVFTTSVPDIFKLADYFADLFTKKERKNNELLKKQSEESHMIISEILSANKNPVNNTNMDSLHLYIDKFYMQKETYTIHLTTQGMLGGRPFFITNHLTGVSLLFNSEEENIVFNIEKKLISFPLAKEEYLKKN